MGDQQATSDCGRCGIELEPWEVAGTCEEHGNNTNERRSNDIRPSLRTAGIHHTENARGKRQAGGKRTADDGPRRGSAISRRVQRFD
jgi:hypothetical protein